MGPTSSTLGPIMVIQLRHCQKPSKNTPPKRCPQWPCSRARINAATTPKHKNSSKTLSPVALQVRRNEKSSKHVPPKRSPQWPCSPTIAAHARKPPPLAELFLHRMLLLKRRAQEPQSTPDKRLADLRFFLRLIFNDNAPIMPPPAKTEILRLCDADTHAPAPSVRADLSFCCQNPLNFRSTSSTTGNFTSITISNPGPGWTECGSERCHFLSPNASASSTTNNLIVTP